MHRYDNSSPLPLGISSSMAGQLDEISTNVTKHILLQAITVLKHTHTHTHWLRSSCRLLWHFIEGANEVFPCSNNFQTYPQRMCWDQNEILIMSWVNYSV